MNTTPSSEQTIRTTTAVEEAEHLFESTRSRLFAVITEIEAGNTESIKGLGPLLMELRKTWNAAREERNRFYEFGKAGSGAVNGEAIDFARARVEIERRMDRLRGA